MASIPHGTTVEAQGTFSTTTGKPTIPVVDITPTVIGNPAQKITFPSQTATDDKTPRIPQNMAPFITAGTITQAMLTDPNTLLRNHITSQTITSTTVISVSSDPASPLFGGGTDNIAFLLGDATATKPNAQTLKMEAVFWDRDGRVHDRVCMFLKRASRRWSSERRLVPRGNRFPSSS